MQEGAGVTPGPSRAPRCALQQMDNAVYTFETLLHQELGKGPTKEELCKSIQRILERVLKVSGLAPEPRPRAGTRLAAPAGGTADTPLPPARPGPGFRGSGPSP